ncbi:DUF5348 domain-containing protein [Pelotomaculum terephthalicicum JT]|uniref:DUF5348 domain-containing protein n=1 Tax=Pelotomaculum TaxID=191373 RepID=UPI0009D1F87B|nr:MULTISPECIES: DUF5348 domain-containing protein [Pelotomaculum]MCG9969169.1 DUF5348 domain-containing protein [Pelotomaculum terephthalicicum JT]OPX87722.1 MAG: hypothetical protein A4E54_01528 [Pelotomaculum sp. PtaB.Bin117]OPY61623.1 MAG: hypothetical protein A4E56_01924 [Pelotomaculum sp. PtaU1.Bin065]
MEYGKLIYDNECNRLDVLFDNGGTFGGFHCGDRLDILQDNEWVPTRVEYDEDWYLFGLYQSGKIPVGLDVRVCCRL